MFYFSRDKIFNILLKNKAVELYVISCSIFQIDKYTNYTEQFYQRQYNKRDNKM